MSSPDVYDDKGSSERKLSSDGPHNDTFGHAVQVGELTFEEDTAGGMGRHLGITSTTLLM
jgi:hypothetical protein